MGDYEFPAKALDFVEMFTTFAGDNNVFHYCDEHPKYDGVYKPRKTKKHPWGCPKCWVFYLQRLAVITAD